MRFVFLWDLLTDLWLTGNSPACQWYVGDPLLELVRNEQYVDANGRRDVMERLTLLSNAD